MAPSILSDPAQPSFDDLDEPLREVTFVVVDLETTGRAAGANSITEIGAVKVRGGTVLGEFATLVHPDGPIPPQITMLTGITDAMVADAPSLDGVLPAFLEFAGGSVLVAHNAPFDVGFLRAACAARDIAWPRHAVVDTVRLARAVLSRDEAPSVRLGALAQLFGVRTEPDHRALHDARATVEVLHALIERLGPLGVVTLPELQSATRAVDPQRRRKRRLADSLPAAPGVYLFRGPGGEVLYVGTSGDLRRRVRSYFTAAETRPKMRRMLLLAERVDHVVCATALEAQIREQRLIAAHQPPYNRRSRQPGKEYWLTTSRTRRAGSAGVGATGVGATRPAGAAPPRSASRGLVVARTVPTDARPALGPFRALRAARRVQQVLTSTGILASVGTTVGADVDSDVDTDTSTDVDAGTSTDIGTVLAQLAAGSSDAVIDGLLEQLWNLSADGRFAQATALRDGLATLIEVVSAQQRMAALTRLAELAAARPDGAGGWTIALVRYGRLAATGTAPCGTSPYAVLSEMTRCAPTVIPPRPATPPPSTSSRPPGPPAAQGPAAAVPTASTTTTFTASATFTAPTASTEEVRTVLDWLEQPDTRLVIASDGWSLPVRGAGRRQAFAAAARLARAEYDQAESA